MNINSNCFLINCNLAKTMRKMCKVIEVREGDLRSPKTGEVKSLVRLFNS